MTASDEHEPSLLPQQSITSFLPGCLSTEDPRSGMSSWAIGNSGNGNRKWKMEIIIT